MVVVTAAAVVVAATAVAAAVAVVDTAAAVVAVTAVAVAVATEQHFAPELFADSLQKPTKRALAGPFLRLPLGVEAHCPEKHVGESYASDA